MKIQLEDIGKRYGKHWLFRHFNAEFQLNDRIGIKGINGSGKSTLLQLIAGICLPSEGQLTYTDEEGKNIDLNDLAGHLSLLSPYMDVPEQLNLKELFDFQEKILPFREGIDLNEFLEITLLKGFENNFIKQYSSGMKQRLKLGLSFLGSSKILFLDEPCSNLDVAGKALYQKLLAEHSSDRIIFIASNEEEVELINCTGIYNLNELNT